MMKLMSVGKACLGWLELEGPKATITFHRVILAENEFLSGNCTTNLADRPEIKNKFKR